MNKEQKEKIAQLAEQSFIASEKLRALQMMNRPNDPEEAKRAYIEYAIAEAEKIETERMMRDAIGGYACSAPIVPIM